MVRLVAVGFLAGCGFTVPVGDNTPVADARPGDVADAPDAIPIDARLCPPAYRLLGDSYYLVLEQPSNFLSHHQTCLGHMAGHTHLAVIGSEQEAIEVKAYVSTLQGNPDRRYYVGHVQETNVVTEVNDRWITFAGDPVTDDLWADQQPDDGDDDEGNHAEQVAALQINQNYLVDMGRGDNVRAICECDGMPVAQLALDYIAQFSP